MRVITFGNEKGGVGKTSTCVTTAAGLASRGKRVVVIDTSAQGNCASAYGLQREPALYDLTVRGKPWKDLLRHVPEERYLPKGETIGRSGGAIFLLPGNHETRAIPGNVSDGFVLLKRILQLEGVVDYVLIDTPPEPSLLHSLVYAATAEYIYITKPEVWALDGLEDSLMHLHEFNPMRMSRGLAPVKVMGVLPTIYKKSVEHDENINSIPIRLARALNPDLASSIDARDDDDFAQKYSAALQQIAPQYDSWVMPKIWNRTVWTEAAGQSVSLFNWAPNSQAALEAWEVVDRVQGVA